MVPVKKRRLILTYFLCTFFIFIVHGHAAQECGEGTNSTITADYTAYPKLILLSCDQGSGEYYIGGGEPPFEVWVKKAGSDWYLEEDEIYDREYEHECSSDEATECGADFHIKVEDNLNNKSNELAVFTPRTTEPVQYDENNFDLMYRNSSEDISVIGGVFPYTWQVAGTGFWFDSSYTLTQIVSSGDTVTLYSDDTACSCTIIITDSCGDKAFGYMKYYGGGIVSKGYYCGLSGSGTYLGESPSSFHRFELEEGYKKQLQTTRHMSKMGYTDFENCMPDCNGNKAQVDHHGNCIDTKHPMMQCICESLGPELPWRWTFYYTEENAFEYYEWECP